MISVGTKTLPIGFKKFLVGHMDGAIIVAGDFVQILISNITDIETSIASPKIMLEMNANRSN